MNHFWQSSGCSCVEDVWKHVEPKPAFPKYLPERDMQHVAAPKAQPDSPNSKRNEEDL